MFPTMRVSSDSDFFSFFARTDWLFGQLIIASSLTTSLVPAEGNQLQSLLLPLTLLQWGSAVLWGMSSVFVGTNIPFGISSKKAQPWFPQPRAHFPASFWPISLAFTYILHTFSLSSWPPSLCSVLNLMLWKLFCSIFLIRLMLCKLSAERGFAVRKCQENPAGTAERCLGLIRAD